MMRLPSFSYRHLPPNSRFSCVRPTSSTWSSHDRVISLPNRADCTPRPEASPWPFAPQMLTEPTRYGTISFQFLAMMNCERCLGFVVTTVTSDEAAPKESA